MYRSSHLKLLLNSAISQLFEIIGKCQTQSDNLPELRECIIFLVFYKISDSWAGNINIIVELLLKVAAYGLYLGVGTIFRNFF